MLSIFVFAYADCWFSGAVVQILDCSSIQIHVHVREQLYTDHLLLLFHIDFLCGGCSQLNWLSLDKP